MTVKTNNSTICLSIKDYEKIILHAKKEFPMECCGLFGGEVEGNQIYIRVVYELTNVDKSSTRFSLDPKEQFKTVNNIMDLGNKWLGSYHSHPHTPSRPSKRDIELALDPGLIYAIVSLKEKEPDLNFYEIDSHKKVRKYKLNILT